MSQKEVTKFVILNEKGGGERGGEEWEQRPAINNMSDLLQLKWWDDEGHRIRRLGR